MYYKKNKNMMSRATKAMIFQYQSEVNASDVDPKDLRAFSKTVYKMALKWKVVNYT